MRHAPIAATVFVLVSVLCAQTSRAQPVSNQSSRLGVVANASIVAVYLGTPDSTFRASMDDFYSQLTANGSYLDWLSEYSTPTQVVGNGSFAGSWTVPAPGGTIDPAGLGAYLDHEIHVGALPGPSSGNTIYMVHLSSAVPVVSGVSIFGAGVGEPPGKNWCAMHVMYSSALTNRNIVYAILPSMMRYGACAGGLSTMDVETFNASHELVEAITDPGAAVFTEVPLGLSFGESNTWIDPAQSRFLDPWEIADICPTMSTIRFSLARSAAVSAVWSNSRNACFTPNPTSWVGELVSAVWN